MPDDAPEHATADRAPRGAPGRVAAVHRQVRPTLVLAALFTAAAPVLAVVPHDTGVWLPLHAFVVGGILLAISGATVLFAVTWGTAPAPPAAAVAVQRWLLASAALVLLVARERGWPSGVVAAAGIGVVAALALLGVLLVQAAAAAIQARLRAPLRFYVTALLAGVAGSLLGTAFAVGHTAGHADRVRAAHVTINVLGLVGLVIAGTLPFFSATQARSVMSRRATARAQAGVLALLTIGVAVTVAGGVTSTRAVTGVGLAAYATGLVRLATILPPLSRKQLAWAGPRLLQLWCGLGWWIACAAAGAVAAVSGHIPSGGRAPLPEGVLRALLAGGYGQILVASLAYLGPVLRGGGHEELSRGFRITRSWVGLAAANVAAVALLIGAGPVAAAALLVWAVDAVARGGLLVAARLRRR